MHRSTGANTLQRSYGSGGSRTLIDEIDDGPLMQTTKGSAMKGEVHKDVESPQNYGFTSVVADAKKGKDGQIEQCAEGFMSYMGGNRAFPVCAIMDDRRHRLKGLAKDAAKGATAIYGQKEWGQQYLNTKDGQFITGNKEKKNRMQLVENQNGKKSSSQASAQSASAQIASARIAGARSVTPHAVSINAEGRLAFRTKSGVEFEIEDELVVMAAAADGGGGVATGGGEQKSEDSGKPTGQKTLHKEETEIALEQNGTETFSQHGKLYTSVRGGSDGSMYYKDRKICSQTTEKHVHMRFGENTKIWVDEDGHWSEGPIMQKKDKHCKE